MAIATTYTHEYQYAATNSYRTRRSGCTWVTGATGADATTGGRIDPSPDEVLATVRRDEERNPTTPGWALEDLKRAMDRLGVPFAVRRGFGWNGVRAARAAGLYVVLQGDSDRFPDGTCSGAFDGDHAIGIPPGPMTTRWTIDDPICPRSTTETEATLRSYAERFDAGVSFGVFTAPAPIEDGDEMGLGFRFVEPAHGTVTIRGAGHAIIRVRDGVAVAVPDGQVREAWDRVELLEPYDDHPGDRRNGFLVGKTPDEPINRQAAFVLASDVTYAPAPVDCSAVEAERDHLKSQTLDYQERIHEIRAKVMETALDIQDD